VFSVVTFETLVRSWPRARAEEFNSRRLANISDWPPVRTSPWKRADARGSSSVRAALEVSGKPIGAHDVLIAGQAIHRQIDASDGQRGLSFEVKGLVWQDWAKPQNSRLRTSAS